MKKKLAFRIISVLLATTLTVSSVNVVSFAEVGNSEDVAVEKVDESDELGGNNNKRTEEETDEEKVNDDDSVSQGDNEDYSSYEDIKSEVQSEENKAENEELLGEELSGKKYPVDYLQESLTEEISAENLVPIENRNDEKDEMEYDFSDEIELEALSYKLQYKINEDKKSVTITGYTGTPSGSLVIPDSINGYVVTQIGSHAFYECTGFTGELVIPDSIVSIGQYAFYDCAGFTGDLIIPNGIVDIEDWAFNSCMGFTGELIIPNGVTRIGDNAFGRTRFTGKLSIPGTVVSIGEWAFRDCAGFTGDLIIPDSVESIGNCAFEECTGFSGELIISEGVVSIGDSAFRNCGGFTGDLILPDSITSIGRAAFCCSGFTGNLKIPSYITQIEDDAFLGCGFTGDLIIPNGVSKIGASAFYRTGFKGELKIADSVTSIGKYAFTYCSCTGDLIIPDSVTYIGEYAFKNCKGFSGVLHLSENLTRINEETFCECTNLKGDLIIPGKVDSIGKDAFVKCGFDGSLTISGSVKTIGERAFRESKFKGSLTIQDGVTTIEKEAFYYSDGFRGDLIIPNSVTNIETEAFMYCFGFDGKLVLSDNLICINSCSFCDCPFTGTLFVPDSVSAINYSAFSGHAFSDVYIPSNVQYIGNYAFYRMSSVNPIRGIYHCVLDSYGFAHLRQLNAKVVEWDGTVTKGGDYAGLEWEIKSNILTISGDGDIPDSVEGNLAPWNAYSNIVVELIISDGITGIGRNNFSNFHKLGAVSLPDSLTFIDDNCFANDELLSEIKLPGNINRIGENIFANCSQILSVDIPENVETISKGSFSNCTNLSMITIPVSVRKIENNAFANDKKLRQIRYTGTEQQWRKIEIASQFKSDMQSDAKVIHYGNHKSSGYFKFFLTEPENDIATYSFYEDDDWFFEDSHAGYNHELARLSLKTEMAAFGSTSSDAGKPERNITDFMDSMGFDYVPYNGFLYSSVVYQRCTSVDYEDIGFAIGSKEIESNKGEKATLIMVAIRGAGYGYEWESNFSIGDDYNHKGFDLAAQKVEENLELYIKKYLSDVDGDDIKIWITGYSRGAAVANLLASKINLGSIFAKDIKNSNVFAYTFECPQNTTKWNCKGNQYNNIYNVINPNDLIPKVAPDDVSWNYSRYGRDYYLPTVENSYEYTALEDNMKSVYADIIDENLSTVNERTQLVYNQRFAFEALVDTISQLIETPDRFGKVFEKDIKYLVSNILVTQNDVDYKIIISNLLNNCYKYDGGVTFWARAALLTSVVLGVTYYSSISQIAVEKVVIDEIVEKLGPAIKYSHYPELTLSWMEAVSGDVVMHKKTMNKNVINCPVDVVVVDNKDNSVVANIVNNKIVEANQKLSCYIDNNGQKIVITPADGDYTIYAIPTDDGVMTYSVMEIEADETVDQIICYSDMNITKDMDYKIYVTDEIVVEAPNGDVCEPDFVASESIDFFAVEAITKSELGYVFGGGGYYPGEFAQLTAIPDSSAVDFLGWYCNDELLSTETTYRFMVEKDMDIEGRFAVSDGKLWISGLDENGYTYTGSAIKPEIKVYDGENLLKEKVDYTIAYSKNTAAHTVTGDDDKNAPTITVTGKGNYSSKETVQFSINRKKLSDEDVVVGALADVLATGRLQNPMPTVWYNKKKLVVNKDFKVNYYRASSSVDCNDATKVDGCTESGTYMVEISGVGNFDDKAYTTFVIVAENMIPVSKLTVAKIKDIPYSGEDINLSANELKVTYKGQPLEMGTDYDITYDGNHKDIGTVNVIITGKGTYSGSRTTTFKITGVQFSKVKVENFAASKEYTGTEIKQGASEGVVLRYFGVEEPLSEGVDYTVSYSKNISVGTATVTYIGKGNYTGVVKKTFKITPCDINSSQIQLEYNLESTYVKGGAKTDVHIKYKGQELKEGTDYTVVYKNNTNVGTAEAVNAKGVSTAPNFTVTGKGNFKGTRNHKFTILGKDISDSIKMDASDKLYKKAKGAWKSVPALYDVDGKKLVSGKDYDKNIVYTYSEDTTVIDGSDKTNPEIIRKKGDRVSDTDIIPAKDGTGTPITIEIAGTGNYSGTLVVSNAYRVIKNDISKAKVTVKNKKTYQGTGITLSREDIDVVIGNHHLDEKEYVIDESTYVNNVKKGNASVTLRGIGDYGGAKKITYSIGAKGFVWWWKSIFGV